eukprot:gb/GECH01011506.1/.p1 GENE.gb/GECH01011506.1/~~gb/GECH01011506.1/.p1  ORF type:complete len:261 (+),score=30.54 gb/GECH01011506.1/:1-783(+)
MKTNKTAFTLLFLLLFVGITFSLGDFYEDNKEREKTSVLVEYLTGSTSYPENKLSIRDMWINVLNDISLARKTKALMDYIPSPSQLIRIQSARHVPVMTLREDTNFKKELEKVENSALAYMRLNVATLIKEMREKFDNCEKSRDESDECIIDDFVNGKEKFSFKYPFRLCDSKDNCYTMDKNYGCELCLSGSDYYAFFMERSSCEDFFSNKVCKGMNDVPKAICEKMVMNVVCSSKADKEISKGVYSHCQKRGACPKYNL